MFTHSREKFSSNVCSLKWEWGLCIRIKPMGIERSREKLTQRKGEGKVPQTVFFSLSTYQTKIKKWIKRSTWVVCCLKSALSGWVSLSAACPSHQTIFVSPKRVIVADAIFCALVGEMLYYCHIGISPRLPVLLDVYQVLIWVIFVVCPEAWTAHP